ncbi:hypothetical protein SRABI82_05995 [Priestia megaterium]|nr:hypothetical protein SRABI82_05995 [Priestia megaterium]
MKESFFYGLIIKKKKNNDLSTISSIENPGFKKSMGFRQDDRYKV